MRPQLQIQAIIKAMTEDVLPALDQTNQLAMQSAQLTIGTLALLVQHLPLEYRYDCDELQRLLDAAQMLRARLAGTRGIEGAVEALEQASRSGSDVLARALADPAEVVSAVRDLRSAGARAVRAAYQEGTEGVQKAVESIVLAMSKEQLIRDRSWLLMQGWEPDPQSVPPIAQLLAQRQGVQHDTSARDLE
jgi:hypothetical protein